MPPAPARTRACASCHERKVRCDVVDGAGACSNCTLSLIDCVPHTRKPRAGKRERSLEASAESVVSKRPQYQPPLHSPCESTCLTQIYGALDCYSSASRQVPLVDAAVQSHGSENIPASAMRPYFGLQDYVVNEDLEPSPPPTSVEHKHLTKHQREYLENSKAFVLPSRPVRDSLLAHFRERCLSWMPIYSREEWEKIQQADCPLLLINTVLTAACAVSPMSGAMQIGETLFSRATVMLHCNVERDPLVVLKSMCNLLWWCQSGPQDLSLHSPVAWRAKCTYLALQLGLHRSSLRFRTDRTMRRLWWFLVGYENLQSATTARPRWLDVTCSNIRPLKLDDFDEPDADAQLALAQLDLCLLLGDLAHRSVCGSVSRSYREATQHKLSDWIKNLAPALHIYNRDKRTLCVYNFNALQLHLFYLTALILLYRPRGTSSCVPSPAVVLAASFVSGIVEEIMARGDVVRFQGAVLFTCFCTSLSYLACRPCPSLWPEAERELLVLRQMLQEFEKKTAGAKFIQDWIDKMSKWPAFANQQIPKPPELELPVEQRQLFDYFGPDMCNKWSLMGELPGSIPRDHEQTRCQNNYQGRILKHAANEPLVEPANDFGINRSDSSTSVSPETLSFDNPNLLWETPWMDMIARFDNGMPGSSEYMDTWLGNGSMADDPSYFL